MEETKNATQTKKITADDNLAIASGILEGHIKKHPQTTDEGIVTVKDAHGMIEDARLITCDTAMQVESVMNDVENLASLVFIMEQAYFNGEPEAALTGQALCHIGSSLRRIQKDLDAIVDQIFGKG